MFYKNTSKCPSIRVEKYFYKWHTCRGVENAGPDNGGPKSNENAGPDIDGPPLLCWPGSEVMLGFSASDHESLQNFKTKGDCREIEQLSL